MRSQMAILLVVSLLSSETFGAPMFERLKRDVVDTARSLYETVAKGTKAVFNDLIGNRAVAVESYRQANDASKKIAPAFSEIFVNPNKAPTEFGPPTRPASEYERLPPTPPTAAPAS